MNPAGDEIARSKAKTESLFHIITNWNAAFKPRDRRARLLRMKDVMPIHNAQIAALFNELADLLEVDGVMNTRSFKQLFKLFNR